jgi:hypothetical protein
LVSKVYTPEAGTGVFPKRSELETTLDLGTRSSGKPLLVEILEQFRSGAGGARPEAQTPDTASEGARQGGAVSRIRAASASSDRSPSSDESPSPDIFARARRSAGYSLDKVCVWYSNCLFMQFQYSCFIKLSSGRFYFVILLFYFTFIHI